MPTYMPVLIDFWEIGNNPAVNAKDVWSNLCQVFSQSKECDAITVMRSDQGFTLRPDFDNNRIVMQVAASALP